MNDQIRPPIPINPMPSCKDVEAVVLGTLVLESTAYYEVRDNLTEECFYDGIHREVFSAISELGRNGKKIDMVTVFQKCLEMGYNNVDGACIATLASLVGSDKHLSDHVEILNKYKMRRDMYTLGLRLMAVAQDESSDIEEEIKKGINVLNTPYLDGTSKDTTLMDQLAELQNRLDMNLDPNTRLKPVDIGFWKLTNYGAVMNGYLVVVGAATSIGKSAFSLNMAMSAIQNKYKVAFFSLEMSLQQLSSRVVASRTGIDSFRLLTEPLEHEERIKVNSAIWNMSSYSENLIFDGNQKNDVSTICRSIRRMYTKHHINGVVIDYLQIATINGSTDNREQQTAEAARRFQQLCRELNIWVILISQLNRSEKGEPTIERLRDSGQIAEAADAVILIDRPERDGREYGDPFKGYPTQGTALVNLAKNRSGRLCKFICGFDASTTTFYDREIYLTPVDNNAETKKLPMPF